MKQHNINKFDYYIYMGIVLFDTFDQLQSNDTSNIYSIIPIQVRRQLTWYGIINNSVIEQHGATIGWYTYYSTTIDPFPNEMRGAVIAYSDFGGITEGEIDMTNFSLDLMRIVDPDYNEPIYVNMFMYDNQYIEACTQYCYSNINTQNIHFDYTDPIFRATLDLNISHIKYIHIVVRFNAEVNAAGFNSLSITNYN